MSWDVFSTKSDSVTVVKERTRTIRIEITETYRETITRRIGSTEYLSPRLSSSTDLFYLPKYYTEHPLLLGESKPEKKKSDLEKFVSWLFTLD